MALSPKENVLRAIGHGPAEAVPHAFDGSCLLVDHLGRRPPRSGVDSWGVTWQPLPESYVVGAGEPADSYAAAYPAESVRDLLAMPFPRADDPELFAGLLDGLDPTNTLLIGQHPSGPLDRLSSLLGMRAAMLSLVSEPRLAAEILDRIAGYHVGIARGYLAAGVGAGWLADDYAGQDGPFLNPAIWRKLILPGLVRIIAVYRVAAVPLFFHTCGRAEAFISDLVDAGVTVFNLQSSIIDLAALCARFGARIAFYGGVSSEVMMMGTPEQVAQSTRAAIRSLASDSGLVLAPDQPLVFPPENHRAFIEAAETYGREPHWRYTPALS